MNMLDVRTRAAADIKPVDVTDLFSDELPALFATRSQLALKGAEEWNAQSLTLTTESGSWTLDRISDGFTVTAGDSGGTAITMSDEDLGDLVNDITTLEMLFNVQRVSMDRGSRANAACWETILRSLLNGVPMYTKGSVVPSDRDGNPLDLTRAFAPDSDDQEMAHFLAETGFLHLSGWLDNELMAEIAEDMDREFAKCTPSDGSWWVTVADGSRRPARMLDFADRSDAVRRLTQSEPFTRIGRLTDDGYRHAYGVEALQKPIGVVDGISDIPWHRDCAQGMHSYLCRSLTVGVQVTGAGPGSAQLGVLPGSHRALMPADRDNLGSAGFYPLFLTTRTGDMTVHCSCLLHMAAAPTEYERKVLYTNFQLPMDPALNEALETIAGRRKEVGAMTGLK